MSALFARWAFIISSLDARVLVLAVSYITLGLMNVSALLDLQCFLSFQKQILSFGSKLLLSADTVIQDEYNFSVVW